MLSASLPHLQRRARVTEIYLLRERNAFVNFALLHVSEDVVSRIILPSTN